MFWFTALIPLIFYLRFRRVGPLGWGTTVFFDTYCVLAAIGLYFRPRTEYHSPVALRGNWLDRVCAFWLVGCAFGPFFGWIVTTGVFPITLDILAMVVWSARIPGCRSTNSSCFAADALCPWEVDLGGVTIAGLHYAATSFKRDECKSGFVGGACRAASPIHRSVGVIPEAH